MMTTLTEFLYLSISNHHFNHRFTCTRFEKSPMFPVLPCFEKYHRFYEILVDLRKIFGNLTT